MAVTSIVVTIRELPSCVLKTLQTLLARTPLDVEIIYVAYGVGPAKLEGIRSLLAERGGQLIEGREWIPQNAARNLGLRHARSDAEYIVFIDNDVTVEPGWLEPLVACAIETGAGVVGPMTLEGDPAKWIIHMTGGIYREIETPSGKVAFERHINGHLPLASLAIHPVRSRVDYVEGHCILVSHRVLTALNGWDESLITAAEYIDLCLAADANGIPVMVEPASVVTYGDLTSICVEDMPQFFQRWNIADTLATFDHFIRKRGLRGDCELVVYGQNFVREHRGRFRLFDSSAEWARPLHRPTPPSPSTPRDLFDALRLGGHSISGLSALDKLCAAVFPSMLDRVPNENSAAFAGIRAAHLLFCDGAHTDLIAAALIYPLLHSGEISRGRGRAIIKEVSRQQQFSDMGKLLDSIHAFETNLSLLQGERFLARPAGSLRAVAVLAALMGAGGSQAAPAAFAEALNLLRGIGFHAVAEAAI